jgi:hypothetical protein
MQLNEVYLQGFLEGDELDLKMHELSFIELMWA